MNSSSTTHVEGIKQGFPATHWTELRGYRGSDMPQKKVIIEKLARKYWRPVYTWLCRKGYDADQAQDLTQGFFCNIILSRDLIHRADQSKGRFRTFLLNALKAHISDEYRRISAKKRCPVHGLLNWDDLQIQAQCPETVSPDEAFHYTWASTLLNEVIEKLEREYKDKNRQVHWRVFQDKVLNPILQDSPSPSYVELRKKYRIADEQKAAAMTTTVKRRFRSLLIDTIRPYVATDPDVEDEIDELLLIFSKGHA